MLPQGNDLLALAVVAFCVVGAIGILWYTRPTGWRLLQMLLLAAMLVAGGAFVAVVLTLHSGGPAIQ